MHDGQRARPVGTFVGHTDGIVHIASKGDGRYLATNSKDQTIKLFDIRGMGSQSVSMAPVRALFGLHFKGASDLGRSCRWKGRARLGKQ